MFFFTLKELKNLWNSWFSYLVLFVFFIGFFFQSFGKNFEEWHLDQDFLLLLGLGCLLWGTMEGCRKKISFLLFLLSFPFSRYKILMIKIIVVGLSLLLFYLFLSSPFLIFGMIHESSESELLPFLDPFFLKWIMNGLVFLVWGIHFYGVGFVLGLWVRVFFLHWIWSWPLSVSYWVLQLMLVDEGILDFERGDKKMPVFLFESIVDLTQGIFNQSHVMIFLGYLFLIWIVLWLIIGYLREKLSIYEIFLLKKKR